MNEILHGLTNRGSGFQHPAFPVVSTWTPVLDDEVRRVLRELLRVHAGQPDYYTAVLLVLLESQPDLAQLAQERERNYDPTLWVPDPPSITGAALVPRHHTAPRVSRVAAEWPVVHEIVLSNPLAATAAVRMGAVSQIITTSRVRNTLRVPWPAWTGVQGDLESEDWEAVQEVRIHHTPTGYPVSIVHGLLLQAPETHRLLTRVNLLRAWQLADPVRRLAVIAMALILDTLATKPH